MVRGLTGFVAGWGVAGLAVRDVDRVCAQRRGGCGIGCGRREAKVEILMVSEGTRFRSEDARDELDRIAADYVEDEESENDVHAEFADPRYGKKANVGPREVMLLLKAGFKKKAVDCFSSIRSKGSFSERELLGMIREFGKLTNPENAEMVLREYEKAIEQTSDVSAYNAVMSAYAGKRRIAKVESIFNEMLDKDDLKPDKISYGILTNAYVKMGRISAAESVLRTMGAASLSPDVHMYTSLIRGYAQVNDLEAIEKCFIRMEDAGVDADLFMYNVAISAARTLRDNETATKLYARMRKDGITPDVFTFTAFIQLYTSRREFEKARKAFDQIRRFSLEPDRHAYCAILVACNREGNIEAATELFDEMKEIGIKPDTAIYNTILSIRVRSGLEIESIVQEMKEQRIRMDRATNTVLSNAASRDKIAQEFLGTGVDDPMVAAVNSIRHYGGTGDVDEAMKQFRKAKTLWPTTALYNAALHALVAAGRNGNAKSLVDEMKQRSVEMDAATYSMQILLMSRDTRTTSASVFRLLEEMSERGVHPDAAIFNVMLGVRAVHPRKVLAEMRRRRIAPDDFTESALIRSFMRRGHWRHGLEKFHRLDRWDPRLTQWMVRWLEKHGEKSHAAEIRQTAIERGIIIE